MNFWRNATATEKAQTLLTIGMLVAVVSSPALAQAASAVDPTSFLKKIIDLLTGTVATSLAIIALIILGFGAFFGMFDFRKVGFWMVGIIFVFGAAWIVESVSGTKLT